MMALDPLNNLDVFPLANLDVFVEECNKRGINEINITGSNTDPLMYKHLPALREYLDAHIPNLIFGLRTNGVLATRRPDLVRLFDNFSVSITSFDPDLYRLTMGMGTPPDIKAIMKDAGDIPIKLNVVMTPETVESGDILKTLEIASSLGVPVVNLREPYGQPHIGDPLEGKLKRVGTVLGMPEYNINGMQVVVWDVHYVEVESINLYANGEISTDYAVSLGHCSKTGEVKDQSHFKAGRKRQQWVSPPIHELAA